MADQKQPDPDRKSPAVAVVLSIIPGLGLFYIGNALKGMAYMLLMTALIVLQVNAYWNEHIVYGLLLAGFFIYQLFDTYNEARKVEKREQEMKKPSLFSAIIILVIGVLFQLAELGLYTYRKLTKFWPMIIIVIGLKIVIDYFSTKEENHD